MTKPLRTGTKIHRVLTEFFAGRQIHRFQAEQFGDHALHSTVSSLETLGLKFERKSISLPTRYGRDCHVKLYWLAPESMPVAAKMLGLDLHVERSPEPDSRAYLLASTGGRS
jgi:hypothetical protein